MVSIRRILCPVDFSEASERCVAHAAALARWRGARLTVLHVESPLTQRLPGAPDERVAHQSDLERMRERVGTLFGEAGVPMVAADVLLDVGRPTPHILDRACSLNADVIVLGSHGHGGFERLVLGSVAEQVLRRAPCDVLVVPPRTAPAAAGARLHYASIVCGVDFSECADRALAVASELAVDAAADLTAVHVIGWPWDESPAPDFSAVAPEQALALDEYRRYLERSAEARLRDLIGHTADPPVRITPLVRHGRAHRELLRVASERHADLIVLGVQGRGPMDIALFGSTASQVVRSAVCPVWITRLPRS